MRAGNKITSKQLVVNAILALSASMLTLCVLPPAHAQFAEPLQAPNDLTDTLNKTQQVPLPPPPGSAGDPTAVTTGDTGTTPTAPTGAADNTGGTNFPIGTAQTDTTIRVFVNDAAGRGLRQVQTIRTAALPTAVASQVAGVLGANIGGGEPEIDVTVTTAQMEQLNQILAPWPQYQMNGNKKFINSDSPAQGYPKEIPNYQFQGPLPTVKTFCRYLVILGVVFATIFMGIASTKIVMGDSYAGSHVVSAIGGLMLLLCAYTIWKIVQMDTFKDNTNQPAVINQMSNQGQSNTQTTPNLPVVPTAPTGGTARSGIPVAPLSGN